MHWFKPFLSLLIVVTSLLILCGCGLFAEKPGNAEPVSASSDLPEWLKLSYRQSGALNFDYVPLDPDEIKLASEDEELTSEDEEENNNGQEDTSADAGSRHRPNPTGSPYAPGTLDDMIWQQKQRDKQ